MDRQRRLKQQVVDAVSAFERMQMAVSPESVRVDLRADRVVVTLQGAACPAEREFARDRQGRELLDRFYKELFRATKPALEAAIAGILGQSVTLSTLTIDPESGTGVIFFGLASTERAAE